MAYLPVIYLEDVKYKFGYRRSLFDYLKKQEIEAALFVLQPTLDISDTLMPETLYAIKEVSSLGDSFGIKAIWGFYMDFHEDDLLHKLVIPKNEKGMRAILSKLISVRRNELYITHFEKYLESNRFDFFIGERIQLTAEDHRGVRKNVKNRRKNRANGLTDFEVNCWADFFEKYIGDLDFVYNTVCSKKDYLSDYVYSVYRKLMEDGISLVTLPRIACNIWPYESTYNSPQKIQGELELVGTYPANSFDAKWVIDGVEDIDALSIVDEVWR